MLAADARRLMQETECPAALADAERDADGDLILWGTQLEYATVSGACCCTPPLSCA